MPADIFRDSTDVFAQHVDRILEKQTWILEALLALRGLLKSPTTSHYLSHHFLVMGNYPVALPKISAAYSMELECVCSDELVLLFVFQDDGNLDMCFINNGKNLRA